MLMKMEDERRKKRENPDNHASSPHQKYVPPRLLVAIDLLEDDLRVWRVVAEVLRTKERDWALN